MVKEKVQHIETLRGFAILLVVIGHVIGSTPSGGMQIDFPSPWRYLYLWIDYVQMPLFTAIAGWVYALKPIQSNYLSFTLRKMKRLLIPMATVATIYFLVQYFTPGTNVKGNLADIWKIYVFPYTIYWYIPSLFLIFITIALVDSLNWMRSISGWMLVFVISYLFYISEKYVIPSSIPSLFSFRGALNQLPYFVAGIGFQRFSEQLFVPGLKWLYALLALTGLLLLQIEWFYPLSEIKAYECLQPLLVIAGVMFLLHQTRSNKLLIWVGGYAYSIYLLHGFGTSGGRIIGGYLGIHTEIFVFVFAFLLAVLGPIIAENILKRNKICRLLFLGKQ